MLRSNLISIGLLTVILPIAFLVLGCPSGPQSDPKVTVPDVVGMTQSAAQSAITNAGLTVGAVSEEYHETVPAANVISQMPTAGSSVNKGTKINLVVSKGPEPVPDVMVPDVTGLTQSAAETEIANAGLTVGVVSEEFSDTVEAGSVISQDPIADSSVAPGSPVDLEVSKGPEPVIVPDVVGMTQSEAEAEIANVGLTVGGVSDAYSETVEAGRVISQDPAAGVEGEGETSIHLVVSRGSEFPDVILDFSATPTQGVSPVEVEFTGATFPTESFASEVEAVEWHWEFGDGESSDDENPRHVYAAPGVYTVRLTVNIDGRVYSHRKANYVTVMPGSSAIVDETGGTVASDRECLASIAEGILPGAIEVRIADTPDDAIRDTLAAEVPIAGSVTVELHPTGEPLKTDVTHDFEMTVTIVLDAPLPPGTELDVYRKGEMEGSWILLDTIAEVDSSGTAATFQTRDIGVFIVREPDEYSTPVLDFDALLAEPEKGLPPPAQASLNKIAGSGPVPIVLIHGAGSYKKPEYARWDRFVEWARNGGLDLDNRYQLWWFLHDSVGRPVGYDFGRPGENKPNNTREFADQLEARRAESDPAKRFPPSAQQFLIVAHSRGGLVARMFTENYPDEVMAVLTLATPHHGSPYAVPDWFFHLIRLNFLAADAKQVLQLVYTWGFDWWEPGQADLAWDDFDGTGFSYGIRYREFNLLTVFSGGSTLRHVLSSNYAGRPYDPNIDDDDLHLPGLYAGGRQPGTTLWDITQKSPESAQIHKFILYGGYGAGGNTNINPFSPTFRDPTFRERLESEALAALAAIMESFETKGECVSHFAANDGMVPLQSALCLKGSPTEPIYQTYRFLGLFDRIKDPLVLDGVQARLPIPVARVRYQEFEGYNHLDMVTGRLSNVTSIDDNILFTYIGADLLSTIASVPVAALAIENSSELSVALDVSDSRDRNTGLWPASSLEYQVDWGDGQIYDWNSTAPTSHTYLSLGDYTITLRVRDRDGMIGFASSNVNMTGLAPSVTSFEINGGAASTTSRTVSLNNTCTGSPTHYMASESSSFTGASWQTYSTKPSFTLSSADGTKTVYFKVKNATGESSAASDSIEVSESPVEPPSVPVPFSPGTASDPGTVISTLTPTLVCSSVSGATQYEFGVSIKPYGTENVVWGGVTASASAPVPAGYLLAGQEYRWNVRAGNSAGWSAWSVQRLYFQTDSGTGGETETIMLPGNVPLDMVWIPAGTFMMGRYPGEQDSYDDEDPQHEVTLTHGFWMGKYELTKAQWTAVMGTEPWSGRDYVLDHPDSPAVCVNWNDAQAFIAALNDYTGKTFRLPSEAEWEYACRAGTTTRFYWGDDPSYTVGDDYCWWEHNVRDVNEKYAHVVGQKLPNAWGLYDMSGNVLEWCEDDSHENYIGAPADGSAWVDSPRGSYRVLRGGSWSSVDLDLRSCRSAARTGVYLAPFACRYGFRVVCVSSR